MSILLALVLGWAFERAVMVITAPNYGSLYNGFGAIDLTVSRQTKAPMAYRVLVPWLVVGIEKLLRSKEDQRIVVYQTIKILLNALAFWCLASGFGLSAALITIALLLVTVKFDYWSYLPELAAVGAAMSGNLVITLPVAILAGMSKETAPVIPVAYYLATSDWKGALATAAAVVLTMAAVRLFVGQRALYCERWMWKYNLQLFIDFFKWKPFYHSDVFIASAITVACVPLLAMRPAGWPVPWAILLAGWTMAKADETRVFSACLPWVAVYLIGGI
jgi:hypothetical protein